MAADLARTPDSGIVVQACGDAHISNFGGFAAPDRRLVFGPNDFDETLPGPWEWDVKRMAASAEIAGRDVGLPADRRRWIVDGVRARVPRGDARLRETEPPRRLVRAPDRERARRSLRRAGWARRVGIVFAKPFARARRKTSLRAVKKLTERVDGELRFRQRAAAAGAAPRARRPGSTPATQTDFRATSCSIEYADEPRRRPRATCSARYRFVDMARKVVGVGSVGTRAWVFLLVGRDGQGPARAAGEGGTGLGARAVPRRERVRQPRRAGRPRPADLAGGERHLPRLAAQRRPRRRGARLLRAPAVGLEGLRRPLDAERVGPARLHARLRLVPGARARPLRRPAGDRRLPRRGPEIRPGDRALLRRVRRPERARPPAAAEAVAAGEVAAQFGV